MNQNRYFESKTRKGPNPLLSSFLLVLLVSLSGYGQSADFLASPELILRAEIVSRIFSQKMDDRLSVSFLTQGGKEVNFDGIVVVHNQKGENSGVLRLDLNYESMRFKFLLNRKIRDGKLVYQMNLIQMGGTLAYRLENEKDGFHLHKTDVQSIVQP